MMGSIYTLILGLKGVLVNALLEGYVVMNELKFKVTMIEKLN